MIEEEYKEITEEQLKVLAEEHDKNWDKVMKLAKENGFIIQAFGGTATLICNDEQIKNYGYNQYKQIQRTNNTLSQIKEKVVNE